MIINFIAGNVEIERLIKSTCHFHGLFHEKTTEKNGEQRKTSMFAKIEDR